MPIKCANLSDQTLVTIPKAQRVKLEGSRYFHAPARYVWHAAIERTLWGVQMDRWKRAFDAWTEARERVIAKYGRWIKEKENPN